MMERFETEGQTRAAGPFKARKLRALGQAFARDEEGSLVVFGLVLMMLMVMLGGLAVDLMRYEERRTGIQNTLDRSVLAAAGLTQKLDANVVVNDYFAKAGLSQYLKNVSAPPGLGYRQVVATASSDVAPFFMHLLKVNNLEVKAGASAEQRATNVEISLVLDVSGSMIVDGERIDALRIAAKEFIDTVITDENKDRVSVSIVPYNGQVNLGPKLFAKFNTTDNHNYPESYCIDLPVSTFSVPEISRTTAFSQSPFADASFSANANNTYTYGTYQNPLGAAWIEQGEEGYEDWGYNGVWCNPKAGNYVRPFLNNKGVLKGYIDGLQPYAATSIDLGLKWGLALLSPDIQPAISSLSGDSTIPVAERIPALFANRPAPFKAQQTGTETTMKVIVLMTDGESSRELTLNDGFKSGLSPIYKSSNGLYSIHHPGKSGTKKYWRTDTSTWISSPYAGSGTAVQMTWSQVWQELRVSWVAHHLYARANPAGSTDDLTTRRDAQIAIFRNEKTSTEKDAQMATACALAKGKDVLIYGIAMDSSDHGKDQVKACSTSDSHYYDVTNLTVKTAFRSVASNITALRLTQ